MTAAGTLTRADLAESLHREVGLSRADAARLVEQILSHMCEAKSIEDIYDGTKYLDVIGIARFSPSSCNTQPWYIKGNNSKLEIYRYKKEGKRGIMPKIK